MRRLLLLLFAQGDDSIGSMKPKLFFYHPADVYGTPGLAEDINAWDALGLKHGTDLTKIPRGSVVVPRFRMLPFGAELEQEIRSMGSELINTYAQHRNIANLFAWVPRLSKLTPAAFKVHEIPNLPEGEYFVKGETNSKKFDWFTSAYAPNKRALLDVVNNLQKDQLIGHQEIVIRPFQKYRRIGTSVDGRPIFHEQRAFYLDGQLLTMAHYWNVEDFGAPEPLIPSEFLNTQIQAVESVKHLARFIVIDYAEYEDGAWGVVELNDGAMAGVSVNSPLTLWSEFADTLR